MKGAAPVVAIGLALAAGARGVQSAGSWLDSMRAAVDSELPQLNASARRLVVAHAAYESGNGTARAALRGFNVFNLTAGSWWKSMGFPTWTDVGGDSDGAGNRITQEWRVYDSLESAVRDYVGFLTGQNSGRYMPAWRALERGDLQDFVSKLYSAGYFQLAPDRYAAGLSAVLSRIP